MNLSVVIPALDAAATLGRTLDCLDAAGEIIVVDGGSSDGTVRLVTQRGIHVIETMRSRGDQLSEGARSAKGEWLLFLHADTRLETGWRRAVDDFTADPANLRKAATFRFELDHDSQPARRLERIVMWRTHALGLPYGDQGLLIHRSLYDAVGGYRSLPIMEDVDLILRVGRRRLTVLPVAACTSAERWIKAGWTRRSAHNLFCLVLYFLGVPPRVIERLYD